MRKTMIVLLATLLLAACGQSYEETKRISRQQRREAAQRDSAALKIAVMPTLDCLPLFVAEQEQLLDTLHGGVRLKMYQAQMDCDTAFERKRVEGMVTDLVRAMRINRKGMKVRYMTVTNANWQLFSNRLSRIRNFKQLDNKIVGMTRYSATDLLCDRIVDSVKLESNHLFRVQLNDLTVRIQMLQNNEIDGLWLSEPQATLVRLYKHPTLADSHQMGLHLGVIAFREQEMRRQARHQQLELLVEAYNKACDMINEKGLKHYKSLIMQRCKVTENVVDALPRNILFKHAQGPQQQDITAVEKWLDGNRQETGVRSQDTGSKKNGRIR